MFKFVDFSIVYDLHICTYIDVYRKYIYKYIYIVRTIMRRAKKSPPKKTSPFKNHLSKPGAHSEADCYQAAGRDLSINNITGKMLVPLGWGAP